MSQKNISIDDCWLFAGYVGSDGYGVIGSHLTNSRKAHRVMYEATIGVIPAGLVCDHLCRIRQCVNPQHIELVTDKENILRGQGATAKNAVKTHCPHGHKYTQANIIWIKNTVYGTLTRRCRACFNQWQRRYYKRKTSCSH